MFSRTARIIAVVLFCTTASVYAQSSVTADAHPVASPASPNVDVKTGDTTTSAFRVFNSANTELLRVTAAGRVGIGTAVPADLLHLYGPSAAATIQGNAVNWTGISNATDLASVHLGLKLDVFGGYKDLATIAVRPGNAGGDWRSQLLFFNRDSAGNKQERLRIDGAGNVGIGTSTPNAKLHVAGDTWVSSGTGKGIIATDTTSVNPALSLIVGDATGYYPGIRFASETNALIGQVFGWKSIGFMLQAGPGHYMGFRVNGATSDAMAIGTAGNVVIGTNSPAPGSKLHVQGNIVATGSITGATVLGATYQDVAEWVPATSDMVPGTVVILNPEKNNEVMPSEGEYDVRVAGVVSAQPGLILGVGGPSREQIATTGRVRVKVDATHAPIRVGDILVTSSKTGRAMRSEAIAIQGRSFHQPGTIIGKALEPLAGGEGEILVLLSLQ